MDNRVFESGASLTAPTAPASPSTGYPSDGDPGTGQAATIPGAYWAHQFGEELRALIVYAGLTPDHEDLTQIREAVKKLGVTGYSNTDNGYLQFGCGTIFQWGDSATITPGTVTFPIAFPTAVFVIICSDSDASPAAGSGVKDTLSQFQAKGECDFWFAIGK